MDARMTGRLDGLHQRLIDQVPILTLDNLGTVADALRQAALLLNALAEMPESFWSEPGSPPAALRQPTPPPTPPPPGHRMVRRRRGGYVPDLGVSVPEVVIRRLELAHGDYVAVEPVGTFPDGRHRYRFQLTGHAAGAPPDLRARGELAMGIVEMAPNGRLTVQRSVSGPLPTRISLNPEDVQHMNIAAGDVVDLADWADDPDDVRVCWVHRTLDADTSGGAVVAASRDARPMRRPAPDPADDDDGDLDDLAADALAGKRVLVVGCEPKRREYEAAIHRLGGEMEWVEGTEEHARLEAAIRRVDGVVLLTRFIRHQSFWTATTLAKGHGVKVVACPKLGIRSVSRAAVELLA